MANNDLARSLNQILKAIMKAEAEALNRQNMKKYSQAEAEIIRNRTRNGFGVLTRGDKARRLKRLETSTINRRKKKKLHPKTTPGKSNLTETGQLLDALYGVSLGKGKGAVRIKPRRRGSTTTNDEVAFHVSGDRPFLELSKSEIEKLEKMVKAKTEQIIERNLSRLR